MLKDYDFEKTFSDFKAFILVRNITSYQEVKQTFTRGTPVENYYYRNINSK